MENMSEDCIAIYLSINLESLHCVLLAHKDYLARKINASLCANTETFAEVTFFLSKCIIAEM